jgi:N,N'-diacetylchitobiose transport system substrate-binding protein
MRRKIALVAAVSATMMLAACGGSSTSTSSSAAGSAAASTAATSAASAAGSTSGGSDATGALTVWLQPDAQTGWPELVQAATDEFNKANPNVTVTVEYQSWADHLTKIDAALAGSTPPDVIELGNTETTKYMAADALADLSSFTFDNQDTWLTGLGDASKYNGKTFAVPYYAGARAVIYRTDMYADAGLALPTSLAEFDANNKKLMDTLGADDKKFSAFYMPGKYWYLAMSYVYDQGGAIATQSGDAWTGALDSAQAQAGLTAWKNSADIASRADKSGTEAEQWNAMAAGNVASDYGNGWEVGLIYAEDGGDPSLKDKIAAYPLPSATAGQVAPTFLGGSVLAVPAKSPNVDLAAQWIKAFTSTANQKALAAKSVLPNSTTLLADVPKESQPFAQAAQKSWFVPTAPNWANVETAQVIPNMLVDILTGKSTIPDATKAASAQITDLLNK